LSYGVEEFSSELLVAAREAKGWSQAEMSYESRVAQPLLWRYEAGRSKPSRTRLAHLAAVLGVRPIDLCRKDLVTLR
jgi:transcriptional regulator with XRE-family HTH domain